MRRAARPC
ncbi:unnamed protein product, partial [Didymodactylos carnosus]